MKKFWIGLSSIIAVFGVIQLVPYGRDHGDPPVRQEPAWDRPETRAYARRACFDCHSNETRWPWYATIAPFSWYLQHDVNEGRREVNFSEWGRRQKEVNKVAGEIQKGDMPPSLYLLAHPEAKLSSAEQQALIAGLQATLGNQRAPDGQRRGEEEEE